MDFVAKYFQELTTVELYEILKARAQVFVVEQRCVYQDLDDVDYGSLHIFCRSGHLNHISFATTAQSSAGISESG